MNTDGFKYKNNKRKNISLPARRAYRPEGVIRVDLPVPIISGQAGLWLSSYNKGRENGI